MEKEKILKIIDLLVRERTRLLGEVLKHKTGEENIDDNVFDFATYHGLYVHIIFSGKKRQFLIELDPYKKDSFKKVIEIQELIEKKGNSITFEEVKKEYEYHRGGQAVYSDFDEIYEFDNANSRGLRNID